MTGTAPARTALAATALVLLAAGCTASPADDEPPAMSAAAGDGGALDTVTGAVAVPGLSGLTRAQDVAVGADGEPVVLVGLDLEADGPLAVVRPTADGGWGQVVLDGYGFQWLRIHPVGDVRIP